MESCGTDRSITTPTLYLTQISINSTHYFNLVNFELLPLLLVKGWLNYQKYLSAKIMEFPSASTLILNHLN